MAGLHAGSWEVLENPVEAFYARAPHAMRCLVMQCDAMQTTFEFYFNFDSVCGMEVSFNSVDKLPAPTFRII